MDVSSSIDSTFITLFDKHIIHGDDCIFMTGEKRHLYVISHYYSIDDSCIMDQDDSLREWTIKKISAYRGHYGRTDYRSRNMLIITDTKENIFGRLREEYGNIYIIA